MYTYTHANHSIQYSALIATWGWCYEVFDGCVQLMSAILTFCSGREPVHSPQRCVLKGVLGRASPILRSKNGRDAQPQISYLRVMRQPTIYRASWKLSNSTNLSFLIRGVFYDRACQS